MIITSVFTAERSIWSAYPYDHVANVGVGEGLIVLCLGD